MTVLDGSRRDRSYWDQRYRDWWHRPFHGMCQSTEAELAQEQQAIEAILDAVLKPKHWVLDAGCGYGRLAPLICERVNEYIGVDFCSAAIDEARKNAPANARFFTSDLLEFTTGPCDVILMVGVRSSIEERFDEVVAHLRGLLKPDGLVVMVEDGRVEILG